MLKWPNGDRLYISCGRYNGITYLCVWNMFFDKWTEILIQFLVIQVFLFSYSKRVPTLYFTNILPLLLLLFIIKTVPMCSAFHYLSLIIYLSIAFCVFFFFCRSLRMRRLCAVILCVVHVLSGLKLYIISVKTVICWRITAYRYISPLNSYRLNVMTVHPLGEFVFI